MVTNERGVEDNENEDKERKMYGLRIGVHYVKGQR